MSTLIWYSQNSQIASDLQELAKHADDVRQRNGLPTGPPPGWYDGVTEPMILEPPTSFLDGPDPPPICSLAYADFFTMTSKDIQDLFRKFPVIVVHGRPSRLHCDMSSLEEWGDPDALRVMHGMSQPVSNVY